MDPKLLKLYEAGKEVFGDWKPTTYQRRVFENVFVHNKTYVFEEWSRGGGKTVTALKLAFLAALLYPGRNILYVAPTKIDADAIIGEKFLSEFPHHLLSKSSASTGIFRFKNGSTLSLLGSEGNASQGKGNVGRGREPVLLIYDEFAYHNPLTHKALAPTLRNKGKLVIISTPPRIDDMNTGRSHHYDKMMNDCKSNSWGSFAQVTCDQLVKEGVCTQEFLDITRTSIGEEEFQAEYMLKRVHASAQNYFQDVSEAFLVDDESVKTQVARIEHPKYIMAGDTSGNTRWGTMFACLDEDKGVLYLLDTIVCRRDGENDTETRVASGMSPTVYWPRVQRVLNRWTPDKNEDDWHIIWDHETLFIDIIPQLFGNHIHLEQVEKKKDKKNEIFSLIRDLIKINRLVISKSCADLIYEMKHLSINPRTGDFVKKLDELLDCLRYIIMTYEHYFESRTAAIPIKKEYLQSLADSFVEQRLENKGKVYEELIKPGDWW